MRVLAALVVVLALIGSTIFHMTRDASASAQQAAPTPPPAIEQMCEGGQPIESCTTQAPPATTVPAPVQGTVPTPAPQAPAAGQPLPTEATMVCGFGPLQGQQVTDPQQCFVENVEQQVYVCQDGSTSSVPCDQPQQIPTPTPQAPAPSLPDVNIQNDVNVDVDVASGVPGNQQARSLPSCPTVFEAQQLMAAAVQLVTGEPCAFNIRAMETAVQVVATPGWIHEAQFGDGYVVIFEGDGRVYDVLAITSRPMARDLCQQWAGSYAFEQQMDMQGVGFDAYVALPTMATCQAMTSEGVVDAAQIGRVIDHSELDSYVVGNAAPAQTVPNTGTLPTEEPVVQVEEEPVVTETPIAVVTATPTPEPVATVAPRVTATPERDVNVTSVPQAGAAEIASCPIDLEGLAAILRGNPNLANPTYWTPVNDGGFQYDGPEVPFIVEHGFMVNDHTNTLRGPGEVVTSSNFTLYCQAEG